MVEHDAANMCSEWMSVQHEFFLHMLSDDEWNSWVIPQVKCLQTWNICKRVMSGQMMNCYALCLKILRFWLKPNVVCWMWPWCASCASACVVLWNIAKFYSFVFDDFSEPAPGVEQITFERRGCPQGANWPFLVSILRFCEPQVCGSLIWFGFPTMSYLMCQKNKMEHF